MWLLRYKQIKMGHHISKCLNIGQSYCLEIGCPILFFLYFGSHYNYRNGFELSACLISMSSLKWDRSQPSKMFIARETMHKSRQYQISRHKIFQYSNICLYLGSRISYRKDFVLQTKLWIPPFQ